MNIAIALNRVVVPQTCVFLRSLLVNNEDEDITVYVLNSDLSPEDRVVMGNSFSVCDRRKLVFIDIDRDCLPDGLPTNRYWSIEMYYRLMLPDILPQEVERILYLDIDMIVNKNIMDLYNADFEDRLLIVSRDQEFEKLVVQERDRNPKRYDVFSEMMNEGMTYFCSGLILFNISAMWGRYTLEYYMEEFDRISDWVVLPDQDLLNYVHWKDTIFVDETRFGLFSQTAHECGVTYDEVKAGTSIIHFTGRAKPWTVNLIRYDIEKIWWEYAKDTPYYGPLLEQVFFNSMDSTLVEDTINKLIDENSELKQLTEKMNSIIKQLGVI